MGRVIWGHEEGICVDFAEAIQFEDALNVASSMVNDMEKNSLPPCGYGTVPFPAPRAVGPEALPGRGCITRPLPSTLLARRSPKSTKGRPHSMASIAGQAVERASACPTPRIGRHALQLQRLGCCRGGGAGAPQRLHRARMA
ncbi:unnamed protein product [Prorocentrum cordatum]|uniref:Uncharacterized protein n=1 Tax=Prorocentrum cordatum TaxID=2364126 RepID=A0ABN9U3K3_9DINO|nr:unnamed protein product [Polarella glacialis]